MTLNHFLLFTPEQTAMPPKPTNSKRPSPKQQRKPQSSLMAVANSAARASLNAYSAQSGYVLSTFLATPSESPLYRMPTSGGPLTTALKLRTLMTATTGKNADTTASTDFNIVLYGQPGRLFECGPVPMAANTVQYIYNGATGGVTFSASEIYTTNRSIKIGGISKGSAMQWPTVRPVAFSGDETYILLNTSEKLRVSVYSGFSASHTFQLRVHRWNGINSSRAYAGIVYVTVAAGTTWYDLAFGDGLTAWDGGYYTFDCDSAQGGATYQFCIDSPALNGYVSVCIPTINQDTASCVRRTACSLLLSNTTAAMDRGGTLTAQRVDSRPINLNSTTVQNLVKNRMSPYQGDSGKGLYTYLAFEEADEAFVTASMQQGSDVPNTLTTMSGDQPSFNLDKPGYVHAVNIVGDSTHVNSFSITVDTVIEFQCDSQLFSRDTPRHSLSELYAARVITNSTPFFFENPLHLRDIGRFLLNSWRVIQRNSGRIADVASAAYPPGRPAFEALSELAQKLPK